MTTTSQRVDTKQQYTPTQPKLARYTTDTYECKGGKLSLALNTAYKDKRLAAYEYN